MPALSSKISPMRVPRATWLATVLFVSGSVGGWLLLADLGVAVSAASLAILITPIIWWRVVAQSRPASAGRGAMAGAIIAPLVWVVPFIVDYIWYFLRHGRPDPAWANLDWYASIAVLIGVFVAVPLGAAFGAMIAFLERALELKLRIGKSS